MKKSLSGNLSASKELLEVSDWHGTGVHIHAVDRRLKISVHFNRQMQYLGKISVTLV
jgi:hypothetical protein